MATAMGGRASLLVGKASYLDKIGELPASTGSP
jgi:hypothetical protein